MKKKKSSGDYEVTILKSPTETADGSLLVEVVIDPGQGNDMHYHPTITEHFEVVSGVLSVLVAKETKRLKSGESCSVHKSVPHRFFNDSKGRAVFRCTMSPARNAEKLFRISNGLKRDGLVNPKGMPKSFWHIIVLFNLTDTYLCALPEWLQRIVFGGFGKIAQWRRIDERLIERYC